MRQSFIKLTMVLFAAVGSYAASAQIPSPGCTAVGIGNFGPVTCQAAYNNTVANDSFCCTNSWDTICQNAYDTFVANNPGACVVCAVVPPACATDAAAVATVQANDTFCCNTSWDALCQQAYDALSGSCSGCIIGAGCGVVPPACVTDCAAWTIVVGNDPFCCNTSWDLTCQNAYDALSVSCLPLPNNGLTCGSPLTLSCGQTVTGNTAGVPNDNATSGAAVCAVGTGGQNWYVLNTGAQSANVTLSACGSSYDTRISIYTGTCGALACVGSNDDFCGLQSQITFTANANTDYLISMNGFGAGAGAYTLNASCAFICVTPPACVQTAGAAYATVIANDTFCCNTAWDLACQNQYDALSASCLTPCTGITVNMFDSFGDGWNGATFNIIDVATNTNVGSGGLPAGASGSATFCLPAGCYSFEVSGGTFPGEVSWDVVGADAPLSGGAPSISLFAVGGAGPCLLPCPTPTAVVCGDVQAGTMDESTALVQGPGCSGIPLATAGDWYVFNGTGDELTVSTCGSTNDTRIHVYTLSGDCGDQASYDCVAGNDDFCALQSQVSFNTVAGTDYYIVVSAFSAFSVGAYTVNFTCAPPCLPTPANDDCGTAQFMLSGILFPGCLDCAQAATIGTVCQSAFQTWYDVWYSFASEGPNGTYENIEFNVPNIDVATGLGFTVWSTPDLGGGTYDCNNLTAQACCGTYLPGQACAGGFFGIGIPINPNTVYLFQVYALDNAGCFEFEATGTYLGCTDPLADNYDPFATQSDGSCTYGVNCAANGGTVVTVNLFDSFGDGWNNAFYTWTDIATNVVIGDGTMVTGTTDSQQWCLQPGCYDFSVTGGGFPAEVSWNIVGADYAFGGGAPSSQTVPVGGADCGPVGCTDPAASNYDPAAVIDDGSCLCVPIGCPVVPPACVDVNSCCYNDVVTADSFCCNTAWDAVCQAAYDQCNTSCLPGCGVPIACNYNPAAFNIDNNLCEFTSCAGCTYIDADNYSPFATLDDGSCTYPPCIDTCPADLNNDGVVGFADLSLFLAAYGTVCP